METRQQLIDLRNQYAVTFMNTLIAHAGNLCFSTPQELAKQALKYADALIAELDFIPVAEEKHYVLELPVCFITCQIESSMLQTKMENIFIGMRIETVSDLVNTGHDKLKRVQGVGKKIIDILTNILAKYGLNW